jgi:Cys-rich repeat protein
MTDGDCDGDSPFCDASHVCVEKCKTSSDCSPGFKCSLGNVCYECLVNSDCGPKAICNPNHRCIGG